MNDSSVLPRVVIHLQDHQQENAIKEMLSRVGLTVRSEADPGQVAAWLEDQAVDVLVLDDLDWWERVKSEAGDPVVAVVLLSEEPVEDQDLGEELAVVQIPSGELDPDTVRRRIDRIMERPALSSLTGSDQIYQLLYEHAPDAMYLNDRKGMFLDGNRAAEKITGYSREELIGRSFFSLDLLAPDQLRKAGGLLVKNLLGRSTGPDVLTLNRKDGSQIAVEVSTFPVEIEGERMNLGIARDIGNRLKAEQEVVKSESRYRSLFQDSPISLWEEDWSRAAAYFRQLREEGVTDFQRYFEDHPEAVDHCFSVIEILDINQATLDLHGADTKEELLAHMSQILLPESNRYFARELAAVAEGRTTFQGETINSTLNGELIHIFLRLNVPEEFKDSLEKVIISMIDITPRVKLERELTAREEYLRGVLESAPDAILTIDENHRVMNWNPGAERMFGYTPEEVVGQDVDDFITGESPEDRAAAEGFTRQVARGESIPPTEVVRFRKDGSKVHAMLTASPITLDDKVLGSIAVYTDISELTSAREKIRHLAHHDALTGLPNRRLFEMRYTHALRLARRNQIPISVVVMDIDGFKAVNDTYGHNIGDQVLQLVGERLEGTLRESDTFARWGGDEFTLLLFNTASREDVGVVLDKVFRLLKEPMLVGGERVRIAGSAGVASYPRDGTCEEELISCADQAMYRAKKAGGDRYCFYGDEGS